MRGLGGWRPPVSGHLVAPRWTRRLLGWSSHCRRVHPGRGWWWGRACLAVVIDPGATGCCPPRRSGPASRASAGRRRGRCGWHRPPVVWRSRPLGEVGRARCGRRVLDHRGWSASWLPGPWHPRPGGKRDSGAARLTARFWGWRKRVSGATKSWRSSLRIHRCPQCSSCHSNPLLDSQNAQPRVVPCAFPTIAWRGRWTPPQRCTPREVI